jgi:hypothetical protein
MSRRNSTKKNPSHQAGRSERQNHPRVSSSLILESADIFGAYPKINFMVAKVTQVCSQKPEQPLLNQCCDFCRATCGILGYALGLFGRLRKSAAKPPGKLEASPLPPQWRLTRILPPETCLTATKENGLALELVKNQTTDIDLIFEAVRPIHKHIVKNLCNIERSHSDDAWPE